jgi:Beta-catenin-interacting protein ICAT
MVSRGEAETQALRQRVNDQLNRLMNQLKDLEENKEALDEDEYTSMREDTLKQLKEFEELLERQKSGNVTLIDDLNQIQIAIREAVSQAFKTPEVIQLFAARQPHLLRTRLEQLDIDKQLGQVKESEYNAKKVEILTALKKLDDALSQAEKDFLLAFTTGGNRVQATDNEVNAKDLISKQNVHIEKTS